VAIALVAKEAAEHGDVPDDCTNVQFQDACATWRWNGLWTKLFKNETLIFGFIS